MMSWQGVEPYALYPNTTIPSITARGFYYGQEYFGTYFRALFTMFQVRHPPAVLLRRALRNTASSDPP